MMTKIYIYNTLTNKVEEFRPFKEKVVGMYVCGPTVYDYDHLGHARVGIFYDIVRRYLMSRGYKVKFVQNITDVGHLTDDADTGEDKIERRAKKEKIDPKEIAKKFEKEHFKDMKTLGILKPDLSPRASEYINDIIKFVEILIKKGYAYEKEGSVYFDVIKIPTYGKLSGRDFSDQLAGIRIKIKKSKKHPADFALWIAAEPTHILKWSSPWSKGYPGWHIECSVMNKKTLGSITDIHGGAIELAFPHHENEYAQSFAYDGNIPVKYWVHIGMVNIAGKKMSKSTGNFITIRDALKKYKADEIRIAFLQTYYRKPFNYSKKVLRQAKEILVRLIRQRKIAKQGKGITKKLDDLMAQDFNTPKVISEIMNNLSKLTKADFRWMGEILGLKFQDKVVKLSLKQKKMIEEREQARKKKNWEEADRIRKELEKQGIKIEDTNMGPKITVT